MKEQLTNEALPKALVKPSIFLTTHIAAKKPVTTGLNPRNGSVAQVTMSHFPASADVGTRSRSTMRIMFLLVVRGRTPRRIGPPNAIAEIIWTFEATRQRGEVNVMRQRISTAASSRPLHEHRLM